MLWCEGKSWVTLMGVVLLATQLSGCPAIVVGGAAAGGYVVGQESDRTLGEVADDVAITAEINARFVRDKQVRARDINVDTYKREVTLIGRVADQSSRKQALSLARQVKGVKRVIDKLKIQP